MPKNKLLAYIILGILIAGVVMYSKQNFFESRSSILAECETVHVKGNVHYHAILKITQDGKSIPIPADIGVVGDCIHPVHTHDTSGLIHFDYPKAIPFTLGDFFDVMGIIFTDRQVGAFKTTDGYKITVKRNNQVIKGKYRNIVFHDRDIITITINKK